MASQRLGSIDLAISHARRLLETNADLAAEQAREILTIHPGHPTARLILGAAHRRAGRLQSALEVLEALTAEFPHSAPGHLELGVARFEHGQSAEAEAALRRAVQLNPVSPDGWRFLADCLDARGDASGADAARARYIKAATHDTRLRAAAVALAENNLPTADALLCTHLEAHPKDVAALRMRAEVAGRLRRYADAEELLERCLALAPSFDAARHNLAVVLNRGAKPEAALPHVIQLLAKQPQNPGYLNLKAAILANAGDYRGSIETYQGVLSRLPDQPKIWMSLGHALRTEGRQDESVAAYRRAISMEPTLGEAYWSLANLKTFRFSADDVQAMEGVLLRKELGEEERVHFEFALGKALEDASVHDRAFAHYSEANALHRKSHPYNADENSRFVGRCKEQLTADFFEHAQRWAHRLRSLSSSSGFPAQDRRCWSRSWRATRQSRAQSSCRIFRKLRAASSDETTRLRRADSSRDWQRSARQSFGRLETATSNRRACTARPMRLTSSTRCRTIVCMSD